MTHFVYILFSESVNRYYIGETVDVEERIVQHNSGFYDTSFSKVATDWKLFWKLECINRTQAIKIEKHIKRMRNRSYYHNLQQYREISEKLLSLYSV